MMSYDNENVCGLSYGKATYSLQSYEGRETQGPEINDILLKT